MLNNSLSLKEKQIAIVLNSHAELESWKNLATLEGRISFKSRLFPERITFNMLAKLKIKSVNFYCGKEQFKIFLKFALEDDFCAWKARFELDAGDPDNLSGNTES